MLANGLAVGEDEMCLLSCMVSFCLGILVLSNSTPGRLLKRIKSLKTEYPFKGMSKYYLLATKKVNGIFEETDGSMKMTILGLPVWFGAD